MYELSSRSKFTIHIILKNLENTFFILNRLVLAIFKGKRTNFLFQESEINICGEASVAVASIATLLILSALHYLLAIFS